jgi:hypothetical protein
LSNSFSTNLSQPIFSGFWFGREKIEKKVNLFRHFLFGKKKEFTVIKKNFKIVKLGTNGCDLYKNCESEKCCKKFQSYSVFHRFWQAKFAHCIGVQFYATTPMASKIEACYKKWSELTQNNNPTTLIYIGITVCTITM